MNLLPHDTIRCIGARLEARDFMCFMAVCRNFRLWLADSITNKLLSHQKLHYYRMKDSLARYRTVLDTSLMGSGKTYTACAPAVQYKLGLTVFCPASVVNVWNKAIKEFGIHDGGTEVYTYGVMRKSNKYLTVKENETQAPNAAAVGMGVRGGRRAIRTDESPSDHFTYETTPEWKKRINTGTLLVFDECQNLKNKSKQFRCALALSGTLLDSNSSSKQISLSATPMDKQEQVMRICLLNGIVKTRKVARYDIQEGYILEGIGEMLEWAIPDRRQRAEQAATINARNKYDVALAIYNTHIKPKISSCMPAPPIPVPLNVKDGYYCFGDEDLEMLSRGLGILDWALRMDDQRLRAQGLDFWVIVQSGLKTVERAKINTFVRLAKMVLDDSPNMKVIIMVNFLDTLDILADRLSAYRPMILQGKTNKSKRHPMIDKFNENSSDHRLLIGTMATMALGISLHDTVGNMPRVELLNANYKMMEMHQAVGRVYRTGTMSTPYVRFVYAKCALQEVSLLKAISRKKAVMEMALDDILRNKVVFPGGYDQFIEPDMH